MAPSTPKSGEKPTAHDAEADPLSLSLQAHFSTYSPAPDPKDGPANPPNGPSTIQELGVPVEAPE